MPGQLAPGGSPPVGTWPGSPDRLPPGGLLGDRVAAEIERQIVQQGLTPGDRLPAGRELAAALGVSRTVVRDAIAALEQRGLLESRPGSGVYVADGSSQAVGEVLGQMLRLDAISPEELTEMRHLLEIHSAGAAASRATPDRVSTMEQAIATMVNARSATAFVEADVAFHEALAGASGNRVLAAVLASLRPLLTQGMLVGTRLPGSRADSVAGHTAILAAVTAGDADAARAAMTAHLVQSAREWESAQHSASPARY